MHVWTLEHMLEEAFKIAPIMKKEYDEATPDQLDSLVRSFATGGLVFLNNLLEEEAVRLIDASKLVKHGHQWVVDVEPVVEKLLAKRSPARIVKGELSQF